MSKKLRIVTKHEIQKESRTTLVGACALRIYYDGNITFSHTAATLMNFEDNERILIALEDEKTIFLGPNKLEGYKVVNRKERNTWLASGVALRNYLVAMADVPLPKPRKKPVEFRILETEKEINGIKLFKLELVWPKKINHEKNEKIH